jgi:hypothetical protein
MSALSQMSDEEFHAQHVQWMQEAQAARQERYAEMDRIIEAIDRQMEEDIREEARNPQSR